MADSWGGALLAPQLRWAGSIGGLIAGPMGLIVLAMYIQGLHQVWNVELVIVQLVACLPGYGVYQLLRLLLANARSPCGAIPTTIKRSGLWRGGGQK